MEKAFINGRVFDGYQVIENQVLIMSGRRVTALMEEQDLDLTRMDVHDLQGHLLAPGLIDIQVNGGGGVMFGQGDEAHEIRQMSEAHRQFGTTGFLPTLISSDPRTMSRAIAAVDQAISDHVPGVLGIHLEGPFLNRARRGIHAKNHIRSLEDIDLEQVSALKNGCTLLTLAPEKTDTETISALVRRGVIVFAGHSDATYEQARAGLDAGISGFTHLFNAMSPLTSREPGMVGAALHDPRSWIGVIADGQHVHPVSLSIAIAAKSKGRSLLVTDAMASVGSTEKSFEWNGQSITADSGSCRLADGRLAGSDLDMISAVRNTIRFTGLDCLEALRMASVYPAHALGIEAELGYIRPGYKASFVELDEDLNVVGSWIDGAGGPISKDDRSWK